MSRTGKDYLNSLKDGRQVFYEGELVKDIAAHPAFSGISKTIAGLYDQMSDPKNDMTYTSPKTGKQVAKSYMIPKSKEDLASKRVAARKVAEATYGLVGRSLDHVANFLAGFACNPELFGSAGQRYADNVMNYYEYARDNNLYVSYAIVQPQIDRSKPASQAEDPYLAAGVVEEREDGIVIRGAQMLATGGALSDHLLLTVIQPLRPGDEAYAISVIVPLNAPGVKTYVRKSYGGDKPSTYDYPLSTRFDETDALMVFDDTFIPWEHVFVYKHLENNYRQFFDTPAHVYGNTQAQIRLVTKLQFILGLAKRMTATTGTLKMPPVQGTLGELASKVAVFEAMLIAAEATAEPDEHGNYVPNRRYVYTAMTLQPPIYADVIQMVRELAGGGMILLPSSYKDFLSETTGPDIRRYIQSPGVPAEKKVQLYKLAWDIIGSEFAGRHHQYEMFYGGAPFIVKGQAFKYYDFKEADGLVDQALAGYSLAELSKV